MVNSPASALQPLPGRDCGECTVCCVHLEIDDPELTKPDEVPCPHLGSCGGCAIYETRPTTCRTWFCGWRLIALGEAMRPDRSKVLLVPEMCHEPDFQKGGLKLVPIGDAMDAVLQPEIVDLAGRCIARGVPIFLGGGAGGHSKRVLINRVARPAVASGDRQAFVRLLEDLLRQLADRVKADSSAR